MKVGCLMDRNWLKGIAGDAMHAILCAGGHNPRLLLRANATSFRLYLLVDLEWFKPLELFPPDQCAATMLRPSDDLLRNDLSPFKKINHLREGRPQQPSVSLRARFLRERPPRPVPGLGG